MKKVSFSQPVNWKRLFNHEHEWNCAPVILYMYFTNKTALHEYTYVLCHLRDKSFYEINCTDTDSKPYHPRENTQKHKETDPKTNRQTVSSWKWMCENMSHIWNLRPKLFMSVLYTAKCVQKPRWEKIIRTTSKNGSHVNGRLYVLSWCRCSYNSLGDWVCGGSDVGMRRQQVCCSPPSYSTWW